MTTQLRVGYSGYDAHTHWVLFAKANFVDYTRHGSMECLQPRRMKGDTSLEALFRAVSVRWLFPTRGMPRKLAAGNLSLMSELKYCAEVLGVAKAIHFGYKRRREEG